jgi:hypothetical protein
MNEWMEDRTCSPHARLLAVGCELHKGAHQLGIVNVVRLWLLRRSNMVVTLARR